MTGSTPPPAAPQPTALDSLGEWSRTHTCGELSARDANSAVTLMGWVHRVRDHGGVLFIDLRDRYGVTQIVVPPGRGAPRPLSPRRASWARSG